ncbi:hypothetical protein [Georgfuchsia toluolica]|nr:hypothetical protein [Georgfuchsia toluolica]
MSKSLASILCLSPIEFHRDSAVLAQAVEEHRHGQERDIAGTAH